MLTSAVPVLPATSTPSSAAAVPVPSLDHVAHHVAELARGLARTSRARPPRAAARRPCARRGRRPWPPAAASSARRRCRSSAPREAICSGVTSQVALADRHAADVDAVGGRAARAACAPLLTPLGDHLVVGVVHRRVLVEAEPLHVLGHRVLAEVLRHLGPDRVDRVRQRRREVDLAEVLAAEVVQRRARDRPCRCSPLTCEPGLYCPESSAAAAVTTFIVEPGG